MPCTRRRDMVVVCVCRVSKCVRSTWSSRKADRKKGWEQKRARKEESYLEDEYLRARRKNLRSPWPAAAIEGIGAGEQRRLSQRKDTGRSALPGAAAARWPPSASHFCVGAFLLLFLSFLRSKSDMSDANPAGRRSVDNSTSCYHLSYHTNRVGQKSGNIYF